VLASPDPHRSCPASNPPARHRLAPACLGARRADRGALLSRRAGLRTPPGPADPATRASSASGSNDRFLVPGNETITYRLEFGHRNLWESRALSPRLTGEDATASYDRGDHPASRSWACYTRVAYSLTHPDEGWAPLYTRPTITPDQSSALTYFRGIRGSASLLQKMPGPAKSVKLARAQAPRPSQRTEPAELPRWN
jgi:hypothetical protein